MKIALLTTCNSHKAGGLYNSVRLLGLSLFHKKVDIELLSYDDEFSKEDEAAYEDMPMVKYTCSSLPVLSSLAYSKDLPNILKDIHPDIIHSQGIWMYNSKAALYGKKKLHAKTIITPRGMLDPWAIKNSHWKKVIAGWFFENENLRNADCIHALNHSEYESIRAYGLVNPVAIIPNGFNIPKEVEYDRNKEKKVLLFIGRIHPKKGIAELLEGLQIVKYDNPGILDHLQVRIAGWDQMGHTDELKAKCSEYGLNEVVSFIGPVLGKDKENELCKADAFVLTSFSEGLPMSVLEAWAYKLPVIMTDQCNLPDGFESKSSIRVTTKPESIAAGLEKLFKMSDEERDKMGENGYRLVENKYTWDKIADQTIQLYDWLLHGGEKPEFVLLD